MKRTLSLLNKGRAQLMQPAYSMLCTCSILTAHCPILTARIRTMLMQLMCALPLLAAGFAARAQTPTGASATVGKEFYLSFLYHRHGTPQIQIKIVVEKKCRITAQYNVDGTYWNGYNGWTDVQPGTYTAVADYSKMVNNGSGSTSKSMTITANEDIGVYAINYHLASTDATVVLPKPVLGKEYRLITTGTTYAPSSSAATYTVVATEANTVVTLHSGSTVTLQKNQTYHYTSTSLTQDLTGLRVAATQPVAVFTGHEIANCPPCAFGNCSADHLYEQLWSVDKWGSEFFVWPVKVGNTGSDWGGMIGVVAHQAGTAVTITGAINAGNPVNINLAAGGKQYVCYKMTGLCKVESTKPIMVFTILPDAALTLIPPINQRVLRAPLSPFILTGNSNVVNHSVEMLIPSAYWNQTVITENGATVANSTYTVTSSIEFPQWYTVRKALTNTNVRINVTCPGGMLGFAYGWGNIESYGYLAGAGAYDLQNYFSIRESATTVDTYYQNTTDVTHTFKTSAGNVTLSRRVETPFTNIIWLLNGAQYTGITENTSTLRTVTIPVSALKAGENTITMSVLYTGQTTRTVYTGRVWYMNVTNKAVSVCSGTAFTGTPVNGTDGAVPPNATYTWTVSPASSTTNVSGQSAQTVAQTAISQTLTNHTNSAKTVTYTVTPRMGSILGNTFTLTVTVNPTPKIAAKTAVICSGAAFNATPANGADIVPSNTTYTWTVSPASSTSTVSGQTSYTTTPQTAISQTLTNHTAVVQTVTYTVTPKSGNCTGANFTVVVTVNPKPGISNKTATICSGATFNATPANGADGIVPTGTTYNWTVSPASSPSTVSGQTSYTLTPQTVISQTLTNHTAVPQTVTYTVTPKSGSCPGADFTVVVTVNPRPSIGARTADICNGETYTLAGITGELIPGNTAYTWSAPVNALVSGITAGTNETGFSQTLTNTSSVAQTLEYDITTSASGCTGQTFRITLRVTPKVTARTDRISVFACKTRTADVLANDVNAAGGTISIVKNGVLATADLPGGSHIRYRLGDAVNCALYGGKRDTVRYRVCSSGGGCLTESNCSEADLVISILRMPRVQLIDSCSRRPWLTVDYQYLAATYQWHTSTNGIDWTLITGATDLKLYVTAQAWYKVSISYGGDVVETVPVHFIVHRKARLQGNLWWYEASLDY